MNQSGVLELVLMGLEPKAAVDVNNDKCWEQWKWMKNYRVWEANRKVFLFPENWIEAGLREDKSFLFTELENELLQNELTVNGGRTKPKRTKTNTKSPS